MVLWPTCFFMLFLKAVTNLKNSKCDLLKLDLSLISWIFLGSFYSHFLSHFARSLRRRFHSIEFKRTQGCKRTYGTRSKPSKLRPSTIGSSLHGGECVEGGYQGEASSVKSLHSDRWFCGNVYWAKFLCKAFFSAILWVSWCYPPNY